MAAGPFSSETLWVADVANYTINPHDDVFLIFHKLSGDTHILNFLSAGILEVLKNNGAANFQTIAEWVWAFLDLTVEECPLDLVEKTILQLDDVALVLPQNG